MKSPESWDDGTAGGWYWGIGTTEYWEDADARSIPMYSANEGYRPLETRSKQAEVDVGGISWSYLEQEKCL